MQHGGPGISEAEDQQYQKVNTSLEKNVMGKRKRSGSFSKTDESGAKKSDDCDSQEELDFDNISPLIRGLSNSATRCSARVQEKQEKLRREASPSKQVLAVEANCQLLAGTCSSSSVIHNVSKGGSNKHTLVLNLDDPPGCHNTSDNTGPSFISSSIGLEEKRKKRNWELWSVEDKQLFFEALNEFGKDFDAIQNYLATKLKPRSKSSACSQYAPKNKDQVRHFYYRTWNKLSKHLRFPSDMKKASQELYGLINYGELRKKQRVLNSKSAVKLCELVENGTTSIKFRGKTCRIKTPVCRALKRLNGLEDVEHTRVPHKLGLEFIPRDGKTWRAVQSVSHNPRVKVHVSLQRTLASVITYFEDRWKRNEDRLKEQFSTVFGKPRCRLRAIPIDTRELNIPVFRVAENTSSTTICLKAYTEHILSKERIYESELAANKLKRKRKQSGGSGPTGISDPHCPLPSLTNKPVVEVSDYTMLDDNSDVESQFVAANCQASSSSKTTNMDVRFPDEQSNEMAWMRFEKRWQDNEERQDVLGIRDAEIVNATTETDNDDIDHDADDAVIGCQLHMEADEQLCACGSGKPTESENFVSHVWDDDRIRLGWTAEEAGVMTLGEVYLMLGQTEKLCFEYSWDSIADDFEDIRSRNLLERLITTARLLKKKKTSRSKATLLNSSFVVNNGPLINCSKCGTRAELPVNLQSHSKESLTPGALNNIALAPCQSLLKNKGHFFTQEQLSPGIIASSTDTGSIKAVLEQKQQQTGFSNPTAVILSGPEISAGCFVDTFPGSCLKAENNQNSPGEMQPILVIEIDNNLIQENQQIIDDMLNNKAIDKQNRSSSCGNNKIVKLQSSLAIPVSKGMLEPNSLAMKSGRELSLEKQSLPPNIKATVLPSSASITTNSTGGILVTQGDLNSNNNAINSEIHRDSTITIEVSTKLNCVSTPLDMQSSKESIIPISGNVVTAEIINKDQSSSFRKPSSIQIAVRPKETVGVVEENNKTMPPKPFLDLPKGNRRLGRRPNFKRVVIPRVLPLLPKVASVNPSVSSTATSGMVSNGPGLSSVLIPLSSPTVNVLPSLVCNSSTINSTAIRDSSEDLGKKKDHPLKQSGSGMYESFVGSVPGSISCSSNDFEDLLKVRRQENGSNMAAGDMDSLSLSSFMEISLPESARMAANECINTDLHIDDLENSNCSLSLSNILNSGQKSLMKDLVTPENSIKPQSDPAFQSLSSTSENPSGLSNLANFETPWHLEPGEMSLSSIFGSYDSARGPSGLSEGDMNFQSMMGDNSLDFVSKLTGLSSPMSDSRK